MSHQAVPQRRATDGRPVSTSVVICALLLLVALAAGFIVLALKGAPTAAFGAFAAGAVPVASTVILAAVKVDKVSSQLDGVSAQLGDGFGTRIGTEVHNVLAGMDPDLFGQLIGQAPLGQPSTPAAAVPPVAAGPDDVAGAGDPPPTATPAPAAPSAPEGG